MFCGRHVMMAPFYVTSSRMEAQPGDTPPLAELRSGRRDTLDEMMPIVYEHLRAIARHQLGRRESGGTLSTTGLVHETYLKLVDQSRVAWSDRAHFFALASVAMRHVLVDRAKARFAQKREGGLRHVTLDNEVIDVDEQPDVLLDINEAVSNPHGEFHPIPPSHGYSDAARVRCAQSARWKDRCHAPVGIHSAVTTAPDR